MSKEAYHTLCQTEDDIPIFSQDWWLDVVCGKANWEVCLIIEQDSRIVGALPVYIPCSRVISMPSYTQTMGVWFAPSAGDAKYASVLEYRQSICKRLIEQLKNYPCFFQNFHHSFTDWLPFYWAGFQQTTRYTYLLTNLKDMACLWEKMSQQTRRSIKKAKEQFQITVKRGIPTDEFIRVQSLTFERQGIKNKQSEAVLRELIHVCRQRQQGDLWGGYDQEGNLHAAVFVVYQKKTAYYLAGGGNPAFRNSGAHSLVLWEAIQEVADYSETFDFEGSMLPGVERFFREFGGTQMPYFTISRGKLSLADRALMKLKKTVHSK